MRCIWGYTTMCKYGKMSGVLHVLGSAEGGVQVDGLQGVGLAK